MTTQAKKTGNPLDGVTSNPLPLIIFAFSLFLSASLMFAVQPMVGKMLLPLAGGTPASWVVAMAFFQIALLFGYMMAWIMSRFSVTVHTLLLVSLLAVGYFTLPVEIAKYSHILETQGISPSTIFMLLLYTVGLPFAALSTVSSTLQRLFTATNHKDANDPYFLYAASNGGSMLGLFSYPLFIEPVFSLQSQSTYWQYIYAGLIVMCLVCLSFAKKKTEDAKAATKKAKAKTDKDADEVTWPQRIEWLFLSFFPSSLLMGTTMHITMDVVSAPLLWVVPLGLYLLTHIFAFSQKKFIAPETLYKLHAIAVCIIALIATKFPGITIMTVSWGGALFSLGAFFIIAFALHTRLSESRPHNKYLTQFYFFLALGGALGGSFNAFLAPILFDSIIEYPLIAIFSCFLSPLFTKQIKNSDILFLFCGGFLLVMFVALLKFGVFEISPKHLEAALPQAAMLLVAFFMLVGTHAKLALYVSLGCLIFANYVNTNSADLLAKHRNFFGVMRVEDAPVRFDNNSDETVPVRHFTHGTTLHGLQRLDLDDLKEAPITSYYAPLISVIDTYKPKHVGLIGLGAGTVRCYYADDRYYTMYEIDPQVVDVAKEHFDYLKDCGNEKDVIVVGDGRLEMEKREDDKYDLIILDAFSSDSIPAHLITTEAFEMYKKRLTKNGVIAAHVSNRYLNLKHVITATVDEVGMNSMFIHIKHQTRPLQVMSAWMMIYPDGTDISQMHSQGWLNIDPNDNKAPYWTDDHSNILTTLRLSLF